MTVLKYEKIRPNAKPPTKAYVNDACWDLYSTESVVIQPNDTYAVDTGLKFEIPTGYVLQVYSRSGLAKKEAVCVYNSPGVIDSGYVGELSVILYNGGITNFVVDEGMKIAQFRLVELHSYVLEEGIVDTNTERGEKGFGSSGL